MAEVSIRPALPAEWALVVAQRRAMFAEIRGVPEEQLDALATAFGPWLAERMARGDYQGWFGVNPAGEVVAGAGVWLMDWPPHAAHLEPVRANILNVYVLPAYRQRGLARALTEMALDWCCHKRVRQVILHASDAGRPIYAALGFAATNEMSLLLEPVGDQAPARPATEP
jgi:ribosomal protein S18 acetylase RimI-like enzyme